MTRYVGGRMKIAFIGLGKMGLPMVENLAKHQDNVFAYDASEEIREQIKKNCENRFELIDDLNELQDIDIAILMLPNGIIVKECLLGVEGCQGLIEKLNKNAIVIDMSSSSPLDTEELKLSLQDHQLNLVDAPVSGSVPKAKKGTLAIMVGGDKEIIEKIEPVLKTMGEKLFYTGKTGSAHTMKALNNYVYAAGLLATSEALLMAKELDIDLSIFADVLNASSGKNVATETKVKQHMLTEGDFKGGFSLALMAKDLRIAYELKEKLGFAPSQLKLCHETWQDALKGLHSSADNLEIYHALEEQYLDRK